MRERSQYGVQPVEDRSRCPPLLPRQLADRAEPGQPGTSALEPLLLRQLVGDDLRDEDGPEELAEVAVDRSPQIAGADLSWLEADDGAELSLDLRPVGLVHPRLDDGDGGVLRPGGLVDPPGVARQGVRGGHRPRDRSALVHGRPCPQQVAQVDRVRRPELGHPRGDHRRERAELAAGLERRRQRPTAGDGGVVAETGQDGGVLRGRTLQPLLAERPRPADRTAVQRPAHRQHLGAGHDAERLELVAVARRVEAEAAGDEAVVVRLLPAVADGQLAVDELPGQLVEDEEAVLGAEHPVSARVVAERRARPEVQLRQAAVEEADGVGEVLALAVGVEDRRDLPVRGADATSSREWSCAPPQARARRVARSMTCAVGLRGGVARRGASRGCAERGHRPLSLTRFAVTWMQNSSLVSRRQPTTIPSALHAARLEVALDQVAQPVGRVAVLRRLP